MPPSILTTAFSISAKPRPGQTVVKIAKAKVARQNFKRFIGSSF